MQKNAEKYTLAQIKNKSEQWHNIITGFNIKNGSITDDNIKKNEIATNKIKGLGDFIDEKISGSSTPQDFSANNLTGTYAALDGSHITGITASQVGAVPYTGATSNLDLGSRTLTTASTGTFGNIKTPIISPSTDSTSAFQINKADGTTNILNVDTTNGRVGIGTGSPSAKLNIKGSSSLASIGTVSSLTADGNFDSSTNWTVGAGWTISGSKANHAAPDAGLTTLQGATSGVHNILYQIKITISNTTAGSIGVKLGSSDSGASFSTNAVQTAYIMDVADNANLIITPTADFNGSIDSVAMYPITSSIAEETIESSNGVDGSIQIRAGGSGLYNTFMGAYSGLNNTVGYHNTAFGYTALNFNTEGIQNSAFGYMTLVSNTTGSQNTALGNGALHVNQTGSNNSSVGHHSLQANTSGSYNTGIGSVALTYNTTGSNNTAVGYSALGANITGTENTAVGIGAGSGNTASSYNTAVGSNALLNGTGLNNTAIGRKSLYGMTTGSYNFAAGSLSGFSLNGTGNIFLGYGAGYGDVPTNAPVTDDYGLLIGYNANRSVVSGTKLTNYVGIGSNALVDQSNEVVIGSNSITKTLLFGNVGIGTTTPAAALDVNGQVKMKVESAQPFTCDATHNGTIAVTSSYRMCICKGGTTTWVFTTDGTTTCTW